MRCPECNTNWVAGVTHCDLCDIDMEEAIARHAKAARKRGSGGGGSVRNRVFGGIGVVWGGGILLSGLLRGLPSGGGAAAAGATVGLLMGVLFLGAGLFYLIRG